MAEHVPTANELIAKGLARERMEWTGKSRQRFVWISPEGHELLGRIMRENGEEGRRDDESRRGGSAGA